MKKYLLTIFSICLASLALAQETDTKTSPWSCTGVVGLNASATGLVNWAAGGNNNLNGVAFGKVRLLYSENDLSWETNLNLEYGLSYIDQKADALQKSSDVIDFNTKLGWQFHKAWYLAASAGFKSQFAYGRAYDGTEAEDPIVSKFLSPSYTDISVGIVKLVERLVNVEACELEALCNRLGVFLISGISLLQHRDVNCRLMLTVRSLCGDFCTASAHRRNRIGSL